MKKTNRQNNEVFEQFVLVLCSTLILLIVSMFMLEVPSSRAKPAIQKELGLEQKVKQFKPEGKEFGDNMVEDNDRFDITYLISGKKFIVTVKKTPVNDIKKEVEAWFGLKGFTPEQFCKLKVGFVPTQQTRSEFTVEDVKPLSCP